MSTVRCVRLSYTSRATCASTAPGRSELTSVTSTAGMSVPSCSAYGPGAESTDVWTPAQPASRGLRHEGLMSSPHRLGRSAGCGCRRRGGRRPGEGRARAACPGDRRCCLRGRTRGEEGCLERRLVCRLARGTRLDGAVRHRGCHGDRVWRGSVARVEATRRDATVVRIRAPTQPLSVCYVGGLAPGSCGSRSR
jgi:hypothetical protein